MQIDRKKVATIVEGVRSLQKLTAMTGTRTTRSQGELLQTLNSAELTYAAKLLTSEREGQTNDRNTTAS